MLGLFVNYLCFQTTFDMSDANLAASSEKLLPNLERIFCERFISYFPKTLFQVKCVSVKN